MRRRALLLVNRHARHGKEHLSTAIDHLQTLGLKLIEESTEKPQDLPDVIRRYQHQVDLVIVGGGDGTLNAAIDGLVDTSLPLGILPLSGRNRSCRRTHPMPKRFRLTRRFPVAMTEDGYRTLKRFAAEAGLDEGEALSFLFENWSSVINHDNLTHRLRQFNSELESRR